MAYCSAAVAERSRGFVPYCAPQTIRKFGLEEEPDEDALLSEPERAFLNAVAIDIDARSRSVNDAGCYGTNYRDCMASLSRGFTLLSSSIWPIPETNRTHFDDIYSASFSLKQHQIISYTGPHNVANLTLTLFTTQAMIVDSININIQWLQGRPNIDSIMSSGTATLLKAAVPACRSLTDQAMARQIKAATNYSWMEHITIDETSTTDRGIGRLCGKFVFVNLNHWQKEAIQFGVGIRDSDTIQRRAGLGGLTRQPISKKN